MQVISKNREKLTLFTTSIGRMYPKKWTYTSSIRAFRHLGRHLKIRKPRPYTCMIDAEDCKIFRLHIFDIALIRDGQSASLKIINPIGVVCQSRRIRANVITLLNVSTSIGCDIPEWCGVFCTCDFGCSLSTCWKFKKVSGIWRMCEVIVEPPFVECLVAERCDRPIIVWECFICYIKTPHAGMPQGCYGTELASYFIKMEEISPEWADTSGKIKANV